VRWTADQMLRRLLPEGAEALWRDPTGQGVLAGGADDPPWGGGKGDAMEEATGAPGGFITPPGEARLPPPGVVLPEGDGLHVIAAQDDLADLQAALAAREGPGQRGHEKRAHDKRGH